MKSKKEKIQENKKSQDIEEKNDQKNEKEPSYFDVYKHELKREMKVIDKDLKKHFINVFPGELKKKPQIRINSRRFDMDNKGQWITYIKDIVDHFNYCCVTYEDNFKEGFEIILRYILKRVSKDYQKTKKRIDSVLANYSLF